MVTTYHPEPGLQTRLAAVRLQVASVEIVDNGSEVSAEAELRLLAEEDGIAVKWNGSSRGLAAALDQRIEAARNAGATWALLLDQVAYLARSAWRTRSSATWVSPMRYGAGTPRVPMMESFTCTSCLPLAVIIPTNRSP